MATHTSIRDRISHGDYEPKMDYESKPAMPKVLMKKADILTDAERRSLSKVKHEYELAVEAWRTHQDAYRQHNNDIRAQFFADVHREYGLDPDDPFVQLMDKKAWEDGHAHGYWEILTHYEELLDFYELYAKSKRKSRAKSKS